jgi:hypothetical protein
MMWAWLAPLLVAYVATGAACSRHLMTKWIGQHYAHEKARKTWKSSPLSGEYPEGPTGVNPNRMDDVIPAALGAGLLSLFWPVTGMILLGAGWMTAPALREHKRQTQRAADLAERERKARDTKETEETRVMAQAIADALKGYVR